MNAERLLELLARNNLIAPHVLEAFRSEIVGRPGITSADEMAKILVDNGVLTQHIAERLLRQLEQTEGTPHETQAPISLFPSERPVVPPPPPLKKEPMLPRNPASVKETPSEPFEPPYPTNQRESRFSRKKKTANPWDSKLILFGAAGLLVLFLVGFFLIGSLFRRSADSLFSKADHAYQNGSYSEAIVAYTEFLDAYPSHSESPPAKIRRALARIRVLVDAKSDWSKSLETAEAEIKSIETEPKFFEETNAELANLLPAIAAGLAGEARKDTSILHAEQAEKALKLIDEYIPRSLRPTEKLAEVRYRIDEVRRRLVEGDILHEAKRDLDQKLAVDVFDARQVEVCYDLIELILTDHPALRLDPSLTEMYRNVSKNEHRAVRPIPKDQLPQGVIAPGEPASPVSEVSIPFQRTIQRPLTPQTDAPVFLYAEGAVYGLKTEDGTPLWKRPVAGIGPNASPVFLPLPKTKRHPIGGVLLLDNRNRTLEQLDEKTGEIRWRLTLDEPFYLSELATDTERIVLGIATRSGRLLTVDFVSDSADQAPKHEIRGLRLPQELSSAPLIDLDRNTICQFAGKNTFYTVPLDMTASEDGKIKDVTSRYFGQQPSTIRVPPFRFGSHLIVIRQRDAGSCVLDVFSFEKDIVQSLPLRGLVDTAPALEHRLMALTTDSGETCLFEWTEDLQTPLRMVAQGSVGGEARSRGTVRYAVLAGQNVWIADRQLMRFEPQTAQSRLLPREAVRKDIVTTAPPLRRGNVLFHAFRQPGFGGVFLQAVSLENASVFWAIELADPIVLEPEKTDKGFRVFTSAGKAYRINPETGGNRFQEKPDTELPRGVFGSIPLGKILETGGGSEIWTPRLDRLTNEGAAAPQRASTQRTIMIYDITAAEATRFRPFLLPASLTATPTILDGKALMALKDGQIALLDPKAGRFVADPFTASLSPDKPSAWSRPVLIGAGEFLVYDNTPDLQGRFALYRIALEGSGRDLKFVQKEKLPMEAPGTSPIAVLDSLAILTDQENRLCFFRLDQEAGVTRPEPPEPLGKSCVWGPYSTGKTALFTTVDGRLHALTSDLKRLSQASPIPVGAPLVEPDGIVLANAAGKVWKIDPVEMKTLFSVETGVATLVGPVRYGDHYYLSGRDGTVYRIEKTE